MAWGSTLLHTSRDPVQDFLCEWQPGEYNVSDTQELYDMAVVGGVTKRLLREWDTWLEPWNDEEVDKTWKDIAGNDPGRGAQCEYGKTQV